MDATPLVILVDMDDTIADYSAAVATKMQAQNPDSSFEITAENWHTLGRRSNPIHSQLHFYQALAPISGAMAALREMQAVGHNVFIVSSPSLGGNCHSDKSQWVEQHLGEQWARRLILTKDKTLVRGHVLIDDKPHITGELSPSWVHVTFARPHNTRFYTEPDRLYLADWRHWHHVLSEAARSPRFSLTC
jgi:5'-nucleotidase